MEPYIIYSSLTLFAMGCLAIVLSILFTSKSRALDNLPDDLSANIFNKTFTVFDPYSKQRKTIHSFLSVLSIVVGFAIVGFALVILVVFEAGFILSLFIILFGLNLIVLEDALQVYQNSKVLINAVKIGSNLGIGDIEVFHLIKKLMSALAHYYISLSIFFITLSIVLNYIWSSALWFFAQYIGFIIQISRPAGVTAWVLAVFLFALSTVIIQILASKIKSRILRALTE
jgi:hypothetical protein